MPDCPPVSRVQFSSLAGPERGDDPHSGDDDGLILRREPFGLSFTATRFDQRHAFAAPVSDCR